jgi:hypothetical protein
LIKLQPNKKQKKSAVQVPVLLRKPVKLKKDLSMEDYKYKITLRD